MGVQVCTCLVAIHFVKKIFKLSHLADHAQILHTCVTLEREFLISKSSFFGIQHVKVVIERSNTKTID